MITIAYGLPILRAKPVDLDPVYRFFSRLLLRRGKLGFETSSDYWLIRYARGADSGAGSYSHLARFKAEVLNAFVREHGIGSVIEFGCGDGNQLRLAEYDDYMGIDISSVALRMCRKAFAADKRKRFTLLKHYRGERAELALSLDVIYHLVEDAVFDEYMRRLFNAATRFVVIYSSDTDANAGHDAPHLRHRAFSRWIAEYAPKWRLVSRIQNHYPYDGDSVTTSFADFFVYARL